MKFKMVRGRRVREENLPTAFQIFGERRAFMLDDSKRKSLEPKIIQPKKDKKDEGPGLCF